MLNKHDVNNALAGFAERAGLRELALGPDNVASAEFGDDGIVAICFDEVAGELMLLSPVARLSPSVPLSRQASLLSAALGFNLEGVYSLGLEGDTGVFLLSLRVCDMDRFDAEMTDFARQIAAVSQWLETINPDALPPGPSDIYNSQGGPDAVVLKP